MVFLDGEPYDRFNLPGLPLLSRDIGRYRTYYPTIELIVPA